MMTFYFTATGNSLYVAKRINPKGELISIPQAWKEESKTYKSEVIGFVFPCYWFAVPKLVEEFMNKNTFEADYFFAVMTYGNISGNGLGRMEKIGKQSNIKFNYTAELLMVDTYLPIFKIEEQLKKEPSKKIEENLEVIIENLSNRLNKRVKKSAPSKMITKLVNEIIPAGDADNRFSIDERCTYKECMVCEQVCSRNNISVEENEIKFLHKCEFCMGCINLCPRNAIHLNGQRSEVRFKNRNISLQEIIKSNDQSKKHNKITNTT